MRFAVDAYVGQQRWERFPIDLVGSDLRMVGEPDDVPAIARVNMPELVQKGYRAYPLADHVADKVVATFDRYGSTRQPSTRYRDLVDLVAIARGASVDAQHAMSSLHSEAARRHVALPESFDVPDRARWEGGYAKEAAASIPADASTVDEALAVVRPFLDPLLQRSARGRWSPGQFAWITDGAG